jgi:hypothetical protein
VNGALPYLNVSLNLSRLWGRPVNQNSKIPFNLLLVNLLSLRDSDSRDSFRVEC